MCQDWLEKDNPGPQDNLVGTSKTEAKVWPAGVAAATVLPREIRENLHSRPCLLAPRPSACSLVHAHIMGNLNRRNYTRIRISADVLLSWMLKSKIISSNKVQQSGAQELLRWK